MKSMVRLDTPSDLNFQVVKASCSVREAPLLEGCAGPASSHMHRRPSSCPLTTCTQRSFSRVCQTLRRLGFPHPKLQAHLVTSPRDLMPEGLQMALNTQALEKRIAAHNVAREDGTRPDQSSLIARPQVS